MRHATSRANQPVRCAKARPTRSGRVEKSHGWWWPQVIKGWDQGCLGMKVGEVRQLTIPADEGYGANGFPAWGIPPNGGLYFGARARAERD